MNNRISIYLKVAYVFLVLQQWVKLDLLLNGLIQINK